MDTRAHSRNYANRQAAADSARSRHATRNARPTAASPSRLPSATRHTAALTLLHLLLLMSLLSFIAAFILPKFLFPSGVWVRRIVRTTPLASPVAVSRATADAVVLGDGSVWRLAGVKLAADPALRTHAVQLLGVATRQGVEVIRRIPEQDAYLLRGEPRVFHWCGNDPVAAHYEVCVLNELLVVYGLASFDPSAGGLTSAESDRLRACETMARDQGYGSWGGRKIEIDSEGGISISDALWLRRIDVAVALLKRKVTAGPGPAGAAPSAASPGSDVEGPAGGAD